MIPAPIRTPGWRLVLALAPGNEPFDISARKTTYLQGLRALSDELGFILIFDEVETGFAMHWAESAR